MDSQSTPASKFFVYGTLQRGEERTRLWPQPPLTVEIAFATARLHDLGPYPAMIEGPDRVRGELWTLAEGDLAETIATLDAVEGFNQGGRNWYVRRVIECRTLDGQVHHAWTYFWGDGYDISGKPVVLPNAKGYCDWKQFRARP